MTLMLVLLIPCILGILSIYYYNRMKLGIRETARLSWHYFLHNKVFIILLACCYASFYIAVRLAAAAPGCYADIYLNYDGASSGLAPNGTRYNAAEILSDEVLELAIENGDLEGITKKMLKDCLEQKPADSDSPVISASDSSDKYSIQTGYRINFHDPGKTLDLDGETIVNAVANAYCDYFTDAYLDKHTLLSISEEELEELDQMDYLDMLNYFEVKASELQRYLIEYRTQNSSYESSATGETFYSLYDKIEHFVDIELERFKSYVLENGVSKDSEAYINKLRYDNKMTDVDYQKDWATYETYLDAVDRYHREMARIVLVPTEDGDEEFYMSRTKIGVDYLSDTAETYLKSAEEKMLEINTNKHAIEQLKNGNPTEAVFDKVEKTYANMKEELVDFAQQCENLISEYLSEKEGSYLVVTVSQSSFTEIINMKLMILCTAVFAVLADVSAMLCCMNKGQNRKRKGLHSGRKEKLK
ncbi:MAG: hypothetical protein Q4C91_21315 [Eubacteriales bacterium]|nr:hypothetical protein [Eubacteriales bacterium]